MGPRGYSRRMYFGPIHIMNLWHRFGLARTLNLVRVSAQDRVLDLGCSDGMLLHSLERYSGHACGVEIILPHLKWAKIFAPQSQVAQAAGESLPFRAGCFSLVFCLEVLEHVSDPGIVVQEVHRVLTPGGRAVITVPIEIGPPLLVKRLVARLVGWNRLETYTWRELWSAGVMRSVEGMRHDRNHFGFDFRVVERAIEEHFLISRRTFFPIPLLGSLGGLRAAYVAARR